MVEEKKVLVTGGSGWIGSHTCQALLRKGFIPVPFDSKTGHDVRSEEDLKLVDGCERVIHLAGILGTHELFETPHKAIDINFTGTLNVLEACKKYGASFTGITMPDVNPSLYSVTKNAAKALAESYRLSFGVPVSHVIAYNAYGPGQAVGPGHPQKIIPTFATRSWAGLPIPIWGDGQLWVDLIHVEDVGRMMVDASGYGDGEVFDAGSGQPLSVEEVAHLVHSFSEDHGIEWLPERLGERRTRTVRDFAEGRGWLKVGWEPRHDLNLIRSAVLSYQNDPEVARLREEFGS